MNPGRLLPASSMFALLPKERLCSKTAHISLLCEPSWMPLCHPASADTVHHCVLDFLCKPISICDPPWPRPVPNTQQIYMLNKFPLIKYIHNVGLVGSYIFLAQEDTYPAGVGSWVRFQTTTTKNSMTEWSLGVAVSLPGSDLFVRCRGSDLYIYTRQIQEKAEFFFFIPFPSWLLPHPWSYIFRKQEASCSSFWQPIDLLVLFFFGSWQLTTT